MNDPWVSINKPYGAAANAKRADDSHPFDFFWAADIDGRCLFIYEYDKALKLSEKIPNLQGISIINFLPDGENRKRLILSLKQNEHREIFYRLCTDILEVTQKCKDSASALFVTIRRTWRWHQLLRGQSDGRLSPEAQKGLIGELRFLTKIILPKFSPSDAMTFWEGPAGLPKDFVIGSTSIEVKARRGAARPFVSISSEHQLDQASFRHLFLYVVNLSTAALNDLGSFCLNDCVAATLQSIDDVDPGSIEIFETKLLEAGYQKEDDYSDRYWTYLGDQTYRVQGEFPRIVDADLKPGVIDVTYRIDLGELNPYVTTTLEMESTMEGSNNE